MGNVAGNSVIPVMWITFAGLRINPVMEREKYSAPARDHPLLDPFSPLHHQWTA
jgi:hypothetical protein